MGFFFFKGSGAPRDLNRVDGRQRRLCIRDSGIAGHAAKERRIGQEGSGSIAAGASSGFVKERSGGAAEGGGENHQNRERMGGFVYHWLLSPSSKFACKGYKKIYRSVRGRFFSPQIAR